MRQVTLAATQMACGEDSQKNVDRAEGLVRAAHSKGANVILVQELFETPYFCKDQLARHFSLAQPFEGNPLIKRFSALARELGVVLPISFFERANTAHFNSLAMIDADGSVLGLYRAVLVRAFAGTSGFRNARVRWRSWEQRSSAIRRRSGQSLLLHPLWTRLPTGGASCRAMRERTMCR
jgi:predicted amidohydrolase